MKKSSTHEDSKAFLDRKKRYNNLLTVYGRNPVYEALLNQDVEVFRLHLANSNRPAKILDDIIALSQQRGADIVYHDKQALSRISKNGKQDQGVAVDLVLRSFTDDKSFLKVQTNKRFELIALDNITNPQNLGMIIRSVCASPLDGILLPQKGCAKLDSLVIKASAGTLFRATLIRCESLANTLNEFKQHGSLVAGLEVDANISIKAFTPSESVIYVLGNETQGLSPKVKALCETKLKIPMQNGVESLNVAVTASLLAFRGVL